MLRLPGDSLRPTFAAASFPRENSLNLIRLVLAATVIYSHAGPISAGRGDASLGGWSLGGWAVVGFFGLSGFLIAGSATRLPARAYLAARILRIYPAFFVCLCLTATVFASLTFQSGSFSAGDSVGYVAKNALLYMKQSNIGQTLASNPHAYTWNGSLWTLAYEFACYLTILGLVTLSGRLPLPRDQVVGAASAVSILMGIGLSVSPVAIIPSVVSDGIGLWATFSVGVLIRTFAGRLPRTAGIAAACFVALGLTVVFADLAVLRNLFVTYLVLWLGAAVRSPAHIMRNDYSYGTYIYGFPVGQLLAAHGFGLTWPWAFFSANLIGTLVLAVASWHVVEKPALAFSRQVSTPLREDSPGLARYHSP